MSEWLQAAASYVPGGAGAGAGAAAAFWFVRWLIEWLGGRYDKTTERLDKRTERLIDRLEKEVIKLTARLDFVESELEECKRLHAEEHGRKVELEAILLAKGEIRQRAQLIVAAEKLDDRERKGGVAQ